MQPLRPDERKRILQRPGVTEADLDEYERLAGARFKIDPDKVLTHQEKESAAKIEKRLQELAGKINPPQPTLPGPADRNCWKPRP